MEANRMVVFMVQASFPGVISPLMVKAEFAVEPELQAGKIRD
jgi:hypothetical protein